MTPERWQQITAVFHAALERDESARRGFLDEACARDLSLRSEVDALLAAHHDAGRFGEAPVYLSTPEMRRAASPDAEAPEAEETGTPEASRRTHPFRWAVRLALVVTVAAFSYGAWRLLAQGHQRPWVGWSEVRHPRIVRIAAVDPAGPAAGRLQAGDRIVSLDGHPPMPGMGTRYQRRHLVPGDTYELTVARDGQLHTERLEVVGSGRELPRLLAWFVVSLVWCGVGLLVGLARPEHPVARLAFVSTVASGLVFFQIGVVQGGLVGQPLHVVLWYHFFSRFPAGAPTRALWRVLLYTLYVLGGFAAAVGLSPHLAFLLWGLDTAMQLVARHPVLFDLEPRAAFFAFLGAVVGTAAVVAHNYRRLSDPDQRRRVRWVMYGAVAAMVPVLGAVLMVALPRREGALARSLESLSEPAEILVYVCSLAIPLSVAYAVVRHRVFDIRVVIRRGLQHLLARRALQLLATAPLVALGYTLIVHRDRTIAALVTENTGYLYWVAAGALSLRFRRPIGLWLDRRFFRQEFDREQMLLGLVDDMGRVDSISQLSALLSAKLDSALHPMGLYLWYRDPGERSAASNSNPQLTPPDFPVDGSWLSWLEERAAVAEFPLPAAAGLSRRASRWFAGRRVNLAVPISDRTDRLAGVLLLGAKRSEEPYSANDRRLLQAVARQAAVARENLRLRAQVSHEQKIRHEVLARLDGQMEGLLKECPACGACFDGPAEHCLHDGQALTLSLPVARTIDDRYRLDRLLGKGGMGAVYEARDLRLERAVAVKILLGRAFGEPTALRRFRREARAAAQLSHRHIVSVYDYGPLEAEGAYIVMERVLGPTLRDELERVKRLSPVEAARWFDPILEGLAAAHAQGIVHRDLKPENVIAQRDEAGTLTVKVLDFGMAKVSEGERPGSGPMTAEGMVVGTVGYMSPEQLLGQAVDARTDIFSVGVMLVEALTGARPFPGRLFSDVSRAVMGEAYHLPFSSEPARALDDLLQRCLAREAGHRPDALALRAELLPLLRACPPLAGTPP